MKGQSLFEVLVAVGVVGIVLLALVGLATSSIKNSSSSKNISRATRYSQEAVEWLRGERDRGWSDFAAHVTASNRYCFNISPIPPNAWDNTGECTSDEYISGTNFIRNVLLTFSSGDSNKINVVVTTSWSDSQGNHDAKAETVLTNWK